MPQVEVSYNVYTGELAVNTNKLPVSGIVIKSLASSVNPKKVQFPFGVDSTEVTESKIALFKYDGVISSFSFGPDAAKHPLSPDWVPSDFKVQYCLRGVEGEFDGLVKYDGPTVGI